jgi:hypothetical protein
LIKTVQSASPGPLSKQERISTSGGHLHNMLRQGRCRSCASSR